MEKENKVIIDQLPEQLSDLENIELLKQMKNGIISNRKLIILHNLKLVKIVIDKYNSNYDKEELFQIGVLGLINSVDKFDYKKEKSFIKYATKCIENEIALTLKDLIENEKIIDYRYILNGNCDEKMLKVQIREYLNSLQQISRESIKMYFGFYGKCYSLDEIAHIFNISSYLIKEIIDNELMKLRELMLPQKTSKKVKIIKKKNKV